ncbi:hypothetical protein FPV67DRAFT_1460931 [Lyophyllum atratum]|nr:hypothetical protein FPV67DRAFT_1460931 [Lyophyllum atratum]
MPWALVIPSLLPLLTNPRGRHVTSALMRRDWEGYYNRLVGSLAGVQRSLLTLMVALVTLAALHLRSIQEVIWNDLLVRVHSDTLPSYRDLFASHLVLYQGSVEQARKYTSLADLHIALRPVPHTRVDHQVAWVPFSASILILTCTRWDLAPA